MTYSHRISESTRHGGRQRREILGIRSSVRQRSASSSPPRRRREDEPVVNLELRLLRAHSAHVKTSYLLCRSAIEDGVNIVEMDRDKAEATVVALLLPRAPQILQCPDVIKACLIYRVCMIVKSEI